MDGRTDGLQALNIYSRYFSKYGLGVVMVLPKADLDSTKPKPPHALKRTTL
jgi:hypothetical protein